MVRVSNNQPTRHAMDKPADFGLTELQLEIKNTCREIGEKKIVPVREKYDAEGIFPRDIAKEFADAGLFGLFIPEQYGGMGGNTMDMVVAVEELSRYCAGIALSLFGTVYPVGLLSTVVVSPLVGVFMYAGILGIVVCLAAPFLSVPFGAIISFIYGLVKKTALFFAGFPAFSIF